MEKSHPEQGDDEIFMGNTTDQWFGKMGWLTKRLGKHGLTALDQPTGSDWKPCFIKRSEVEGVIAKSQCDGEIDVWQRMLETGSALA